jgi:hypothetical protein
MLFRRASPAEDARRLVDEAEREIEAIRAAIRVNEPSNGAATQLPSQGPGVPADRAASAGRAPVQRAS